MPEPMDTKNASEDQSKKKTVPEPKKAGKKKDDKDKEEELSEEDKTSKRRFGVVGDQSSRSRARNSTSSS